MSPGNLSHGGDGNQDGQDVHGHLEDDNHSYNEVKEPPSDSNKEKNDDLIHTIMIGNHMPAIEYLPLTINDEIKIMFLTLGYSQAMGQKPVEDQGIDSSWTLTSLFVDNVSAICEVIKRPDGIVSRKIPHRANQISVLVAKNVKLTTFMFKMECCFK